MTDSRTGYDVEAHLRDVAAICARSTACLLEAANEYYHPTQSDLVQDATRLFALARRAITGRPWSLGAPPFDELQKGRWPVPAGDFITVHLDRGRPFWQQVAHVRGLARISERTREARDQQRADRRGGKAAAGTARGRSAILLRARCDEPTRRSRRGVSFRKRTRRPDPRFPPSARAPRRSSPDSTAFRRRCDSSLGIPEPYPLRIVSVRGAAHVFTATDGERWWGVLLNVSGTPVARWRTAGQP